MRVPIPVVLNSEQPMCHEYLHIIWQTLFRMQGLVQSNITEIKVIGALQHSHLLGVAITTRHFRNGSELKPLITDPHYDFDFQEVRLLPNEVPVYAVN